jgi:hypothetical protein
LFGEVRPDTADFSKGRLLRRFGDDMAKSFVTIGRSR